MARVDVVLALRQLSIFPLVIDLRGGSRHRCKVRGCGDRERVLNLSVLHS